MHVMRLKFVGLVASLLVTLSQAAPGGGGEQSQCWPSTTTVWQQWQAATVTETQTQVQVSTTTVVQVSTSVSVSTVVKPTTITAVSTVTQPVTVTIVQQNTVTNTITQPVTSTDVQEDTVTNTITQPVTSTDVQEDTVTNTITQPVTSTDVQQNTVTNTLTQPVTVTDVQHDTVVSTVVSATTATVSRTVTIVNLSTITNTAATTVTSTTTVSTCPNSSSSLSGLVTCTSRIINPTYTPPAPLPTNYHWGCPPGTICTPPQIGCNWEQNPPAESYVCNPSECKPVQPLPNITDCDPLWPNPTRSDCAWYNPVFGYFHLNPEQFNLTFAIFNVYGQPVCPSEAPTQSSGFVGWTKPTPSSPPKLSRRIAGRNPLAAIREIRERQSVGVAPAACYTVFDSTSLAGQNAGYDCNRLCAAGTNFRRGIAGCQTCDASNAGNSGPVTSFSELQVYLNWCNAHC